jgi:CspA family cold shock protein
MLAGTVKWFDARKGYGFILGPDGSDVFVHFTCIDCDGFRSLRDGEKVQYELVEGDKGWHAQHVKRLRAAARREPQKVTA